MPTIKDIAVYAGVSHGTVSNVLNKKGNVSSEKIQLVEQAAKELGYNLNVQAQQLRAGMTKKVCVILPRISLKSYNDLYVGMERYLRDLDFSIELFCTDNIESSEEQAVKKAISLNPAAVVLVSSFLKNKGMFSTDIPFFFVERTVKGMPKRAVYAGFFYEQAGRDMALRCVADGHRTIALLCENSGFSNNKEFINSVTDIFDDHDCTYRIFPSDDHMWFNKAFDILTAKEDFDAVIAMSREDAEYLRAAARYHPDRKIPMIYALTGKGVGLDGMVTWYRLNYKLLGKLIAMQIGTFVSEDQKSEDALELRLDNDGFAAVRPMSVKRKDRIRFLTIQNPTSKAIQMLLPSFTEESGIEVQMIEMSYDEHYKISQTCVDGDAYDLIRIDMAWMAELGSRIYHPLLEDEDVAWLQSQVLPGLSPNYSHIKEKRYAFPLDACVQMLFYRKDLFEDELIKREYFERFKRKLEIPKTFAEYNEVAAFFTKRENVHSRTQYGIMATYGRTFLAACDFLPRFREQKGTIFAEDGKVDILNPQMKQAFREYLEACRYASSDIFQWWGDTTRLFLEGDSAMYIVFSNYASDIIHNPNSRVVGRVACATVPGGQPLSGGGSVGISRHTKKYAACMEFLKWLYRDDVAEMITYLGGYVCNRQISRNMDILELYPWIENMEQSFETAWRTSSHEKNPLFNEFLFEDILGKAIRSAASGIEELEVVLEKAQKECDVAFSCIERY